MNLTRTILMGVLALACAGCSGAPRLLGGGGDGTPDEFLVLPNRSLEIPASTGALPPPTPGGVNRADPNPQAEAIAALGGRPGAGVAGDEGLVSFTTRYGVDPAIRADLAAADLDYRRANDGRLLERLFDVNVYYDAYAPQQLDQARESERFRRAGVRVPAAPAAND